MIQFFLVLAAAYLVLPLVIGSFYLKFKHWVAATPDIRPVAPDNLATGVREYIDKAKKEFSDLGFDFRGYWNLAGYAPGVVTTFGLFHHDDLKRDAMAAVIQFHSGNSVEYCEFSNKYITGSVVNVNNTPELGAYKDLRKRTYRYPRIRSIKELFALSEWVARQGPSGGERLEPQKGREIEMMVEALKSETRQQAKYGYYILGEGGERYLPTWKGAVLMTLKHVFPVKQIRNLLDLQAAKKVIKEMP